MSRRFLLVAYVQKVPQAASRSSIVVSALLPPFCSGDRGASERTFLTPNQFPPPVSAKKKRNKN